MLDKFRRKDVQLTPNGQQGQNHTHYNDIVRYIYAARIHITATTPHAFIEI